MTVRANGSTSETGTVASKDGTTIGFESFGSGDSVVVVGGSLTQGDAYCRLAEALALSFSVHVIDRRGRGTSGPQGADYCIEKECEDLLAVASATNARLVFGHSYGGLIALETANRSRQFARIAVYEPGVSIGGSASASWVPKYKAFLARGDMRGAFTCMVREAGYAPKLMSAVPFAISRALLRMAIRGRAWRRIESLLPSHVAEHEQVLRLDSTAEAYRSVAVEVLLLSGSTTPGFVARDLRALNAILPSSQLSILPGLGHAAPTGGAAARIAERVRGFFVHGVGEPQ